mmetsp:Transcript_21742/g.51217  ORF Transcript_21742/g.51217 Transcript_21742/m.51217 type:complete len:534 (+) Transcript_21742:941-2542(+)
MTTIIIHIYIRYLIDYGTIQANITRILQYLSSSVVPGSARQLYSLSEGEYGSTRPLRCSTAQSLMSDLSRPRGVTPASESAAPPLSPTRGGGGTAGGVLPYPPSRTDTTRPSQHTYVCDLAYLPRRPGEVPRLQVESHRLRPVRVVPRVAHVPPRGVEPRAQDDEVGVERAQRREEAVLYRPAVGEAAGPREVVRGALGRGGRRGGRGLGRPGRGAVGGRRRLGRAAAVAAGPRRGRLLVARLGAVRLPRPLPRLAGLRGWNRRIRGLRYAPDDLPLPPHRGDRDVDHVVRHVVLRPRPREELVLEGTLLRPVVVVQVDREEQEPLRVLALPHDLLGAVAVVHVEVYDRDPLDAVVAVHRPRVRGADGHVVQEAEAVAPVGVVLARDDAPGPRVVARGPYRAEGVAAVPGHDPVDRLADGAGRAEGRLERPVRHGRVGVEGLYRHGVVRRRGAKLGGPLDVAVLVHREDVPERRSADVREPLAGVELVPPEDAVVVVDEDREAPDVLRGRLGRRRAGPDDGRASPVAAAHLVA